MSELVVEVGMKLNKSLVYYHDILIKNGLKLDFACSTHDVYYTNNILSSLWAKGEQTIKEIGKTTGLAKTSLSSMLYRMEKQNLIQKIENKEDGRSTIIKLTEKSKSLEKIYQYITDEMVIQYYNGFSEEEIRTFESTLERVVKNLEENNNG